jgi:hypothetical protein
MIWTDMRFIVSQKMAKLNILTNIQASDEAIATTEADWTRSLADSTMLDVTLYFARFVYASRLQGYAIQFTVAAYRGRAIRSIRERIAAPTEGLNNDLLAAILVISVLDVSIAY